jgi:hypothetical protein
MLKTAALLLILLGLALLGRMDRDGRIVMADLGARALGYLARVEVTVERAGRPHPAVPVREWGVGSGTLPDRCGMVPDSLMPVVVWR